MKAVLKEFRLWFLLYITAIALVLHFAPKTPPPYHISPYFAEPEIEPDGF